MLVLGAGQPPALVGQRQHEGHGRIAQRLGRGPRHRPRHIGHAIMQDAVHLIDRVGMGGGARGLETAALINRHIDQHRARLHRRQLRPRHQLRRRRPGDQHRTDHHIGLGHQPRGQLGAGIAGLELPAIEVVQRPHPRQRAVQHRHIRPHSGRHPCRMRADHAAADHHDLGRQNPRHAADQHAAPAIGLLQRPGADLRRQLPRHLGHRRQQRQPAPAVRHRLIGDGGDARGQQIRRLFGIGRQMQIGEQHLPRAQLPALDRLRFLHLDHQLGLGEDLGRGLDDRCPRRAVIGIGEARAQPGAGLDDDLMARGDGLMRGGGGDPDAEFLWLDLPGTTDQHDTLLRSALGRITQIPPRLLDFDRQAAR